MPEATGHDCILPFDTQRTEFARGFEAGRIWATLRAMPSEPVIETVHAANSEMLLRMGEATNRTVAAVELERDWLEATFDAEGC